jgi:hypothetical protein
MSQTQTRKIRKAIEPVLKEFKIEEALRDFMSEEDDGYEYMCFEREIIAAIKPLLSPDTSMSKDAFNLLGLGDEKLNAKLKRQDKMIARVKSETGYTLNMGGNGKGEATVKQLMKLEDEQGLTIEEFWKWNISEEQTYNCLRFAVIRKDPMSICDWMEAKADEYMTEAKPKDTKLYHKKYVPEEETDEYIPNPNK